MSGSSYTAEYWQYDSRIGRRWNKDPVIKVYESPYVAFGNSPTWVVDPLGLDSITINSQGVVTDITVMEGDDRLFEINDKGIVNQIELNDQNWFNDMAISVGMKILYDVSQQNINWFMKKAGVPVEGAIVIGAIPALVVGSHGGDFDFAVSQLWGSLGMGGPIGSVWEADGTPVLLRFEGSNIAYNIMDAGNWLWGYSTRHMSVGDSEVKVGSNLHALLANQGWNFDSPEDQAAIFAGRDASWRAHIKANEFIDSPDRKYWWEIWKRERKYPDIWDVTKPGFINEENSFIRRFRQ